MVLGHELIFVKISPTMSGDYYCFQRDTQRIKYKLRGKVIDAYNYLLNY